MYFTGDLEISRLVLLNQKGSKMNGMDVTRIAETEIHLVLEEMKDCNSVKELNNLFDEAKDLLEAYYNSLLVNYE